MEGFGASTYGDGFAAVYDRWYPDVTDTAACVERLAELAGPAARVLELGIGTGRIALPLAERGLQVTGVDASTEMLALLAAKPGAEAIEVVVGDMARLDDVLPRPGASDSTDSVDVTDPAGGAGYALAFAVYNTLFNLPSSDAQGACIRAVAARLAPSGRLVVEGFVPADDPSARRDDVAVSRIETDELVLSATLHDREAQTITGQHVQITADGIRLRPWLVRYLLPTQLDEIAVESGLELEHRWADWQGAPFDDTSAVHVSVYRRAP